MPRMRPISQALFPCEAHFKHSNSRGRQPYSIQTTFVRKLTADVSMEIHRDKLRKAVMRLNALCEFRPSLVSGKGQSSDWTVPVVNWDSKTNSDSELCSLV